MKSTSLGILLAVAVLFNFQAWADEPASKSCKDMGLYYGDTCVQNCKNDDGTPGKCRQLKQDDHGAWCWECIREGQAEACGDEPGWGAGRCSPGKCKFGETCTESKTWTGFDCYKCHPADKKVCPFGWKEGNCMMAGFGTRGCGFGEMCVDNDVPCWKCVSTESSLCEDPLIKGICPQKCPEGHYCKTINDYCSLCIKGEPPKPKNKCAERKLKSGPCPGLCLPEQVCDDIPVENKRCHKCAEKPEECGPGEFDGVCPGSCSYGKKCVQANDHCYSCREETGCERQGGLDGPCPGSCKIDENHYCEQAPLSRLKFGLELSLKPGTGQMCHRCRTKGAACFPEWTEGTCGGGSCPENYMCVAEGPCYQCRPNKSEVNKCLQVWTRQGPCPAFCESYQRCVDVRVDNETCHYCDDIEDLEDDCWEFDLEVGACPGDCYPQVEDCEETSVHGHPCFECVPKKDIAWCTDGWGVKGTCRGLCTEGQLCLQRSGPCYACMNVRRIEITYIVVIIETPWGRYVLDKDSPATDSLEGFTPSSIMALARLDSPEGEEAMKLAQQHQGKGVTVGTLPEIAGKIQERLGGKRTRYNAGCFDTLQQEEDFGKKNPQSGLPEKKKKRGEKADTPPAVAGYDTTDDIRVDGPVLACGQTGKDNTLAVFGAGGSLIGNYSQKDIADNPDLLAEALKKAEDSYDREMALAKMTVPAPMAEAAATPVEKIAEPRVHPDKARRAARERQRKRLAKINEKRRRKGLPEKVEETVDPDDPLYFVPDGKKKKKSAGLFGAIGGSSSGGGGVAVGLSFGIGAGGKKGGIQGQWGIQTIGFTPKSDPNSAWNVIDGRQKNVLVALIDSGIDMTHPDAPEYIWTNPGEIPDNGVDDDQDGFVDDVHGWNFIDNNSDLTDRKGHGTFVAGIIAAKTNNDEGIAGINPGAVIMPLKVADKEGYAVSLNIARAVSFAVDHGARIINICLGGQGISRLEQAAINDAWGRGVFVVIASGNHGKYLPEVGPAIARNAFTVGAIDHNLKRSLISSHGPNNAIMAPGELIYSIRSVDSFSHRAYGPDSLERFYHHESGTSFSAPMVTGTASLLLAEDPTLNNRELAEVLIGTADDMEEEGWDGKTGAGRLNAADALRAFNAASKMSYVRLTNMRVNRDDNKRLASLDVFATVRVQDLDHYTVEVGKGKRPGRFVPVTGPLDANLNNGWVAHVDKRFLRGSKDWVVRLRAVDREGKIFLATTALAL